MKKEMNSAKSSLELRFDFFLPYEPGREDARPLLLGNSVVQCFGVSAPRVHLPMAPGVERGGRLRTQEGKAAAPREPAPMTEGPAFAPYLSLRSGNGLAPAAGVNKMESAAPKSPGRGSRRLLLHT